MASSKRKETSDTIITESPDALQSMVVPSNQNRETVKYDTANSMVREIVRSGKSEIIVPEIINAPNEATVFFADDDRVLVKMYNRFFEKKFKSFTTFKSAEEILNQYSQGKRAHVVVSDMNMENMTGYELFTELLSLDFQERPIFILFSGNCLDDDMVNYIEQTGGEVLMKPISVSGISDSIHSAIIRHVSYKW
ncbi:response regulator [Candidatus Peregrinibacteria bacterium]|nr:response regulator [Candidatus Peregrinibacteria bacterium]